MDEYSPEESKSVNIIFNGKKYEKSFVLYLPRSINSLKRLKDIINSNLKHSISYEKLRIFNYKSIEIDNTDIEYLTNSQFLFVSLDGSNFSIINYFNEYNIVKPIKSGGYGKIYLAEHSITKRHVAMKINDLTNLSNEEVYNISREALFLESLKHKHIIKYINSFSYEKSLYTIMEYAQGGELGSYINEKKWLLEEEVKCIFLQILEALKYIHNKNIIHRDLKPNNILFLDKNKQNIVIIDFGISGYSCGNIHDRIKAGTVKFVPPELASGINYSSSTKIDVWALGIILYNMLFGVLPFEGLNDSEVTKRIIEENIKYPINIPISSSCTELLNGLLNKNPSLRIELNSILIEKWIKDDTKLNYKTCNNSLNINREDNSNKSIINNNDNYFENISNKFINNKANNINYYKYSDKYVKNNFNENILNNNIDKDYYIVNKECNIFKETPMFQNYNKAYNKNNSVSKNKKTLISNQSYSNILLKKELNKNLALDKLNINNNNNNNNINNINNNKYKNESKSNRVNFKSTNFNIHCNDIINNNSSKKASLVMRNAPNILCSPLKKKTVINNNNNNNNKNNDSYSIIYQLLKRNNNLIYKSEK